MGSDSVRARCSDTNSYSDELLLCDRQRSGLCLILIWRPLYYASLPLPTIPKASIFLYPFIFNCFFYLFSLAARITQLPSFETSLFPSASLCGGRAQPLWGEDADWDWAEFQLFFFHSLFAFSWQPASLHSTESSVCPFLRKRFENCIYYFTKYPWTPFQIQQVQHTSRV